ncbi:MAG: transcription antitermination factor NusB [Pseudopedobacter saltans]|uniref:Transcription antitermination protein NusB n=1 Tax=Pseudopedobacter saltans TaxID=151895 RepID=A0A2W5F3T8_9SPHI|nr:MAG: transcription antitermination factor NusB [Pseudopedobacter saltans]
MISRRSVRIKVMQVLYSIETINDESDKKNPVRSLNQLLDNTKELLTYLLYFIVEVGRYAETDAAYRASKNLLSSDDLNVNIKLAGNDIVWKIMDNSSYKSAVEEFRPRLNEEGQELIKKTYHKLIPTPEYKTYIAEEGRSKKSEIAILDFIFSDLMFTDEQFLDFALENFSSFSNDVEMLNKIVTSILHKPQTLNLSEAITKETQEYGNTLLKTVLDKKGHLSEIIKPKLRNWDPERIAHIDMILLEMGVAELLYFETIPPKVTINEYIDIAKEYSTEQSGQFVNGILDSIRKDLETSNKLHKIDFRK